jgi:hypothetical protein
VIFDGGLDPLRRFISPVIIIILSVVSLSRRPGGSPGEIDDDTPLVVLRLPGRKQRHGDFLEVLQGKFLVDPGGVEDVFVG